MNYHLPVLLQEVINQLSIKTNNIYVDATLGHGGHTLEILKNGGIVYGFDQDPKNIEIAINRINKSELNHNFFPINSNFNQLQKKVNQKVDGLLADLGLSQNQQTDQDRGFSFNDSLSLDMRLDPTTQILTAEEIINTYSFDQLYQIFTKLGQELYSKPLILKIIKERQKSPIKTGQKLADIVRKFYLERHIHTKIDPSTKIFLSLRITVNEENINLQKLLKQSLNIVKTGGTVCIITFHSGEDRIVKQFIKDQSSKNKIIANKSIKPSFSEIKQNPLSRSAILRSYKIV
ncbi:MAG: 16S rRNA (cytosine(1402)-N(4))-methyltransferase RsmH [Candidatus Shapirobacteria bacterium]|jgi:16S rRNA (cytosine1402-N4)-methyltransferase